MMRRNEFPVIREPLSDDEEFPQEAPRLYDFREEAKPGDAVRLLTDQGMHELVRLATATEDDDPMKLWRHEGLAADLTLFEPSKFGASLRLPGKAVLERGDEVRVNYVDLSPHEAIISRSLGRVTALAENLERQERSPARA